jgi:hypothetical protein
LGDTVDRGDDPNEMGELLPYLDLGWDVRAVALSAGYYQTCALLDDHALDAGATRAGAS